MSGRVVEMVWTCSSCRRENLGRHLTCQTCGSPKEEHEEYRMPGTPAALPSVSDPRLLRIAHGGANWRCRYCGSNQRAADGDCAQCGGDRGQPNATRPALRPQAPQLKAPSGLKALLSVGLVLALGLVALIFIGLLAGARRSSATQPLYNAETSHAETARVVSGAWSHRVYVERWQIVEREGFAEGKPQDAMQVEPLGERQHHVDKVPDGFDTETYTVEEPNGFRTEMYSEQEQCGQDCTQLPQSCHEVCTPQGNGFAKCDQVCTGGGQSCSPKYCSVTKTRQVPQTHQVTKTRQVPKFNDVPVMRAYFRWKQWAWQPARTVVEKGSGWDPKWPTDEQVKLGEGLAKDEKERKSQRTDYSVLYRTATGIEYTYRPRDAAEYVGCRDSHLNLTVWPSRRPEAVGRPIAGAPPASSVASP